MRQLLTIAFLLTLIMLLTMMGACSTKANITTGVNNSTVGTITLSPSITSNPSVDANDLSVKTSTISPSSTLNSPNENAAQIMENDILLRISTSKDTYIPGEVILITASVENQSPYAITYRLSSQGDPTPYIF
jgi:hypothetical protein